MRSHDRGTGFERWDALTRSVRKSNLFSTGTSRAAETVGRPDSGSGAGFADAQMWANPSMNRRRAMAYWERNLSFDRLIAVTDRRKEMGNHRKPLLELKDTRAATSAVG